MTSDDILILKTFNVSGEGDLKLSLWSWMRCHSWVDIATIRSLVLFLSECIVLELDLVIYGIGYFSNKQFFFGEIDVALSMALAMLQFSHPFHYFYLWFPLNLWCHFVCRVKDVNLNLYLSRRFCHIDNNYVGHSLQLLMWLE